MIVSNWLLFIFFTCVLVLAGADTADIKIPVGRYTIDFVKGNKWIDEEQLFGFDGVRVENAESVFSAWDAKEPIVVSIK